MKQHTLERANAFARSELAIGHALLVLATACLGCSFEEGPRIEQRTAAVEELDEPPEPTKPTGSQDCNITGHEVLRVSLQDEGEFSRLLRTTDTIPVRVDKDAEVSGGTLALDVVVTSIDAPDARSTSNHAIASEDPEADIALPISGIRLPTHSLAVSRKLTVHAKLIVDDGRYEAARPVRLYFHPQTDGWQFYDEAVRDRDFSAGALTEAERAKRAAALGSLKPGTTAEYVNASATKLSDDPAYIPPDDATTSEETP